MASNTSIIEDFQRALGDAVDRTTNTSLSQFIKPTQVLGNAYIEPSIATDDIAVPLMGVLNQMYVSFVMCALGLSSMVTAGQTARSMLKSVTGSGQDIEDLYDKPALLVGATRGVKDNLDNIAEFASSRILPEASYQDGIIRDENGNPVELLGSTEVQGFTVAELEKVTQRLVTGRVIEFAFKVPVTLSSTRSDSSDQMGSSTTTYGQDRTDNNSTKRKEVITEPEKIIIKETISNDGDDTTTVDKKKLPAKKETVTEKDNGSSTTQRGNQTQTSSSSSSGTSSTKSKQYEEFKIYIYVQIFPTIIPTDVCEGFMELIFPATIKRRWTKVRAGEIRFWKDFVFGIDLAKRKRIMMKNDPSGIIAKIIADEASKTAKHIGNQFTDIANRNLSNSFIIIDKNTFTKGCNESGVNFNNYLARQRFFLRTYSIMMVVVDSIAGRVDMYINGFNTIGNYTFDMINKVGATNKDNFDFKQVMTMMSTGTAPRF